MTKNQKLIIEVGRCPDCSKPGTFMGLCEKHLAKVEERLGQIR